MRIALAFIASLCLLGSTAADAGLSKREQRNQRQAQKLYVSAMESIRGGEIEKSQTLLDNALRLDPHNPGALVDALNLFKSAKLNLTWIESFPAKSPGAEYVFFVDFEGHRIRTQDRNLRGQRRRHPQWQRQ